MTNRLDLPVAFRSQFSALTNKTYLNFGGQGVISEAVLDAIARTYRQLQSDGPFSLKSASWLGQELNDTREALAKFFGGESHCFALTQNVTEACNIALWGLSWQPGENLVISGSEHPGVVDAVLNLARRNGLEVRYLELRGIRGVALRQRLESLIDDKTRMLLVSHVLWNTGETVDLPTMLDVCRAKGVLSLVDGAQSAGVLPLDLNGTDIDFYAITGHKWLGGPEGTGCLYVNPRRLESLEPTYMGWRHHMKGTTAGAEKFEIATSAYPLLAGWREALNIHDSAGNAIARYERILENCAYLRSGLAGLGARLVDSDESSGLVAFMLELPGSNFSKTDYGAIVARLDGERIMLRSIPADPDTQEQIQKSESLRVSLHYFSSQDDMDRLLAALARLLR